ncbi:sensor histidine kinase [Clostridium sp.]|uniref:sensor histidine kinase n=1 Tax=Clostridium sp. TaxID=1506 RepID=UPI0039944BEB
MNNYILKFENLMPHKGEDKYKVIRLLLIKYLFIFFSLADILPTHSIFAYVLFGTVAVLELIKFLFFTTDLVYYPALTLNIILTSCTLIYSPENSYPIIFILLSEIINNDISKRYFFVLFHCILFFIFEVIFIIKNNSSEYLITITIIYFFILILLILSKNQRKNRKKIYTLNKELQEQNLKLQEYSLKIEELTLEKERTRVAQELHDSLGHYLMAISMHLDFLERTLTSHPQKAQETISKTKEIVNDSIKNLRKTVYELKENKIDRSLTDALNSLLENLSIGNSIDFHVTYSNIIETLSPNLKDIIYKTVKESLTNAIKHGNPSSININILLIGNKLHLTIGNTGKKGSQIIMSNGLNGIKNRIESYKGTVNFSYTNVGFKVSALIDLTEKTI